jgi:hypothetical protein
MSGCVDVWDNAAMKSFFSSLKTERTSRLNARAAGSTKLASRFEQTYSIISSDFIIEVVFLTFQIWLDKPGSDQQHIFGGTAAEFLIAVRRDGNRNVL